VREAASPISSGMTRGWVVGKLRESDTIPPDFINGIRECPHMGLCAQWRAKWATPQLFTAAENIGLQPHRAETFKLSSFRLYDNYYPGNLV